MAGTAVIISQASFCYNLNYSAGERRRELTITIYHNRCWNQSMIMPQDHKIMPWSHHIAPQLLALVSSWLAGSLVVIKYGNCPPTSSWEEEPQMVTHDSEYLVGEGRMYCHSRHGNRVWWLQFLTLNYCLQSRLYNQEQSTQLPSTKIGVGINDAWEWWNFLSRSLTYCL